MKGFAHTARETADVTCPELRGRGGSIGRPLLWPIAAGLSLVTASGAVHAQSFVYPNQGQSQEQQTRDEGECHTWAVQKSGVDPAQVAQQGTAGQPPMGGERVRGAARGAAVGAVGGAIAGDAGTGAAAGAAMGTMAGGMRQRQARREQEQANQQAQAQRQAQLDNYNRAYAACLEGRGYTLK